MVRGLAPVFLLMCQALAGASTDTLRQALSLFNARKYQESRVLASQYLQENASSSTAYKVLGMDEYMLGHSDRALALVMRATELAPRDADALYYLARLYFSTGKMPAALEAFQKTIAVDPSSVRAYDQLGQTYEALSRNKDAESAYLKAVEVGKDQARKSEWPDYHLGVMYLDEGRVADSVAVFRRALEVRPEFADAKIKLATALSKDHPVPEAFDLLEQAIATEPENAEAHYRLALLLTKAGKRAEAREQFELFQKYRRQ